MSFQLSALTKEKTFFVLSWMVTKATDDDCFGDRIQPVIENTDGTWSVERYITIRLSSFDYYQTVSAMLKSGQFINEFQTLLEELAYLSDGRRVMLDPSILDDQVTCQGKPALGSDTECRISLQTRPVTATDLMRVPGGPNEESLVNNLIWLAGHVATAEVVQRIYLSQLVTQHGLLNSISTIIGRKVSSPSLNMLQGADGALFWLVVVAARTSTLLGIMDCSKWLIAHLLESTTQTNSGSISSGTLTSDSLDESADRFLRGLAMANLLALAFHFYRPEQAPAEDFYFNFGAGGELEPAASHHNARLVADLCRGQKELQSFLALLPTGCIGLGTDHDNSLNCNMDLHRVNLIGFCSQGLARSPAHRRLHNAALAAELYKYFTCEAPDRQIPPLKVKHEHSLGLTTEVQNQGTEPHFYTKQVSPPRQVCHDRAREQTKVTKLTNGMDRQSPVGSDPSCSSGGKGTYRLDSTTISDELNTQCGDKVTPHDRLGKGNLKDDSLWGQIDEGQTTHLIHPLEGGVYIPAATAKDGYVMDVHRTNRINAKSRNRIETLVRPKFDPLQQMFTKHATPTEVLVEELQPPPHKPTRRRARSTVSDQHHNSRIQTANQIDRIQVHPKYSEPFEIAQPVGRMRNQVMRRPNKLRSNKPTPDDTSDASESLNDKAKHLSHLRNDQRASLFSRTGKPHRSRNKTKQELIPDSLFDCKMNGELSAGDTEYEMGFSDEADWEMTHKPHQSQRSSAPMGRRAHISQEVHVRQRSVKQPHSFRGPRRSRSELGHYTMYPTNAYHSSANDNPCLFPVFYPINTTAAPFAQPNFNYNAHPPTYQHPRATWVRPSVLPTAEANGHAVPGSFYLPNPMFVSSENKEAFTFVPTASIDQMCQTSEAVDESSNRNVVTSSPNPASSSAPQPQITNQCENAEKPQTNKQASSPIKRDSPSVETPTKANEPEQPEPDHLRIQSFFVPFESDRPPASIHTIPRALSRNRKPKGRQLSHANSQEETTVDTLPNRRMSISDKNPERFIRKLSSLPPNGLLPSKTSSVDDPNQYLPANNPGGAEQFNLSKEIKAPSPTSLLNGFDHQMNDKLLNTKDKLDKRDKRRELEKQRREIIFQAYLDRKHSISSDKEVQSDQSRPSSGGSSKNGVPSKTPDIPKVPPSRRTSSIPRRTKLTSAPPTRKPQTQDDNALLSNRVGKRSDLPNTTDTKLFVQLQTKSNRRVIANALSHCCLAGPVNQDAKQTALTALGCSDGKHFMILLRSQCQYAGLYSFSAAEEVGVRISGLGPKRIDNSLVERFYKYDSGSKRFTEIISTSHLSTVVDAIMLKGKTRNRYPSANPTN